MSDMNSSLPIRTENNGDAVIKVVDFTVNTQGLTVNADGSVNITDNGGSLTVDATNLDIRDLAFATDKVDVSGSSVTVTATDLDIRDLSAAQDNVAISDGTDTLAVNADGSINSVVTATNLDIRDLTHVSDSIKVGDGTDFLAVNADGSLNITDNGGSLTVDATNLDIRDLVFATDKVDVSGSSVTVTATDLDIRDIDAAQDNIAISDGTDTLAINADGSINSVVTATNLDIRDLTHASDSVKVGDGTDFLAVNTDGSINVVMQEDSGLEVVDYDTTAAVAGGASDNHDWTSAAASKLYQVFASASGKLRIEVQIETAAASNTFVTKAVGFNSTANPNIDITLSKYAAVPNGARVRVIRTNKDNQAQDVYSTIVAIEG